MFYYASFLRSVFKPPNPRERQLWFSFVKFLTSGGLVPTDDGRLELDLEMKMGDGEDAVTRFGW